jgi:RNA polymerase sigma-70 factor, ECF subfamily
VSGQDERPADSAGALPQRGVEDEELVRLAQDGRREAFEELVRRHADRLYSVVLRFSGDPAETEEVVQETFLRAWRGIGLKEAKRRAGRRPPVDAAEQRDVRAALERAVRALPVDYRAPLILRDVEGLSTQQAAAILGLQEAAFKSRLHRARLAVRAAIENHLAEQ